MNAEERQLLIDQLNRFADDRNQPVHARAAASERVVKLCAEQEQEDTIRRIVREELVYFAYRTGLLRVSNWYCAEK